jgi:serine/threonine protein kinase
MWSLGVLLYVMLQGNYPFLAKTEEELFQKIKLGRFHYIHPDISNRAKFLIESLLRVNPLERLTIKEVLSDENLQWFNSI